MIRDTLLAAAFLALAAIQAAAQTTPSPGSLSAGGNIGSAALRNGYPSGGGAITLPALAATVAGAAATTTSTVTSAATGTFSGAGGGGGRGGGAATAATGGAQRTRTGAGRGNGAGSWVLCPPAGSSGEAAFFAGTDLSCAPQ